MITIKQEEKLLDRIKSLSEIELEKVMGEIYTYLRNNKMDHLLSEENSDMEDRINNLEKGVEELDGDNTDLYNNINEIKDLCDEALDRVQDIIKKIKQLT